MPHGVVAKVLPQRVTDRRTATRQHQTARERNTTGTLPQCVATPEPPSFAAEAASPLAAPTDAPKSDKGRNCACSREDVLRAWSRASVHAGKRKCKHITISHFTDIVRAQLRFARHHHGHDADWAKMLLILRAPNDLWPKPLPKRTQIAQAETTTDNSLTVY